MSPRVCRVQGRGPKIWDLPAPQWFSFAEEQFPYTLVAFADSGGFWGLPCESGVWAGCWVFDLLLERTSREEAKVIAGFCVGATKHSLFSKDRRGTQIGYMWVPGA